MVINSTGVKHKHLSILSCGAHAGGLALHSSNQQMLVFFYRTHIGLLLFVLICSEVPHT